MPDRFLSATIPDARLQWSIIRISQQSRIFRLVMGSAIPTTLIQLPVQTKNYAKGDTVTVTLKVTNKGDREGKETVQLYVHDKVSTVIPREKGTEGILSSRLSSRRDERSLFPSAFLDIRVFQQQDGKGARTRKFRYLYRRKFGEGAKYRNFI